MGVHKGFFALFLLLLLWLAGKFLLPLCFPFLLGTALALAAEPLVALGVTRLKLRRGAAAGLAVTVTLLLITALALLVGAFAIKELGALAIRLPQSVQTGAQSLELLLTDLCAKAPAPLDAALSGSVQRLFDNSSALVDQAVARVPGMLSGLAGWVPGKAVSLVTGILSGYFICVRLPKLKEGLRSHMPQVFRQKLLPALGQLRKALGSWLLAQGKLMAITYGIVTVGLLVLQVPYASGWALLVTAVDAIPLLGTGTVLIPWALVGFLQGDPALGIGLLVLYGVAAVTRTVLEPRFFGAQMGLDPLVMLVFLYLGYRLWGFWGIVVSPLLAAAVKSLTEAATQ